MNRIELLLTSRLFRPALYQLSYIPIIKIRTGLEPVETFGLSDITAMLNLFELLQLVWYWFRLINHHTSLIICFQDIQYRFYSKRYRTLIPPPDFLAPSDLTGHHVWTFKASLCSKPPVRVGSLMIIILSHITQMDTL